MQTKSKLLLAVTLMLLGLTAATIINISLNFREYIINSATEKAKMTATIVKDGLTAHMVNGIMDKREYFLDQISRNEEIQSLWISRSDNVIKQYGNGFINETARDSIDNEVLTHGKIVKKVTESANKILLRVTIPYTATSHAASVNCLSCHDVKKGDTLGAISMEFDISDMRNSGMLTILKILGINLLFIVVVLFLINHYVSPYLKLFINLQVGIKKAHSGNFTHRFKTTITGDEKSIVSNINTLFSKMQETFGDIKQNLSTFMPPNSSYTDDPLYEAKTIIHELSDIYKFKKTIELDASKSMVYSRIVDVLKIKYLIHSFALYEVNNISNTRKQVFCSEEYESICFEHVNLDALECRANRTHSNVISTEFIDLCKTCHANEFHYICIPFSINSDASLIISIAAKNLEELHKLNSIIPNIEHYLEAAKPVIESKILMDKLRESSLRDAMTGLYNRRFLEEFIDQVAKVSKRTKDSYSVMMLDVDFFKMVNDTYGHDVGDKVIVEIGKVLKENIRESDLAIRYGGEEFVVLLHNANEEGTQAVAQKIHAAFGALTFDVGTSEPMKKTMSIGIAQYPKDGDTIWKCIKFADTALYVAKTTGRNKIVHYLAKMSEMENVR